MYLTIGSDADYEKVLVLTEGKVMYKELGYGKPHREIMSMADWLLIAADARLLVHIEPARPAIKPRHVEPVAQPVAQPVVQPVAQPAGTIFSWRQDHDNRRTAIQLKDGRLLQVKSIVNGEAVFTDSGCRVLQTTFPDYNPWAASLPEGQITHRLNQTVAERKKATPIVAASDPEMVQKLLETWGVNSYMLETPSNNEALAEYIETYKYFKERLAAITLEDALECPRVRRSIWRRMTSKINQIRVLKEYIARETHIDHDRRPCSMAGRGTANLIARIGGVEKSIAYHKGKIACEKNLYNSFAELGVDMKNGKPDLAVWRYRKWTNLA